jgi:hypothetical protein
MFMLHKSRARKPLAVSNTPSIGFHPSGVGGIDGHEPVVSLQVGDYRLYVTKDHFDEMVRSVNKLIEE